MLFAAGTSGMDATGMRKRERREVTRRRFYLLLSMACLRLAIILALVATASAVAIDAGNIEREYLILNTM